MSTLSDLLIGSKCNGYRFKIGGPVKMGILYTAIVHGAIEDEEDPGLDSADGPRPRKGLDLEEDVVED